MAYSSIKLKSISSNFFKLSLNLGIIMLQIKKSTEILSSLTKNKIKLCNNCSDYNNQYFIHYCFIKRKIDTTCSISDSHAVNIDIVRKFTIQSGIRISLYFLNTRIRPLRSSRQVYRLIICRKRKKKKR